MFSQTKAGLHGQGAAQNARICILRRRRAQKESEPDSLIFGGDGVADTLRRGHGF